MRRSQLFTKTLKDAPADEVAKNAQLLIKAGFVHKEMAGAYVYLPLGLRVFNKIVQVIREEMNALGATELFMTSLQRPEPWQASGRWSEEVVDVWFKTELATGQVIGLANTHEEAIADMMRAHVQSYKDLPKYTYQFQTKFRNELRSKSGIMRGREFIMKDLYSLSRNEEEHSVFYEKNKEAYARVFERLGIGESTFLTFASGGSFSKFSHEFQTICDAGEDIVYLDREKKLAVNEEVYTDEVLEELGLDKSKLEKVKTAEVGNIFTLGTKYAEAVGLHFTDSDGQQKPVFMGSYGIGPGRTMGVIVESFSDEKGLVWPMNIAPYHVYLASVGDIAEKADELYRLLQDAGVEVLYDDRDERPGAKFADAELMGIPYRLVVSERSLEHNAVELKGRTSDETAIIDWDQCVDVLKKKISLE
jgi:prolyl-tRNA synthetase